MTNINGWACFFLVSLRLVTGWHFFIEAVYKIHTHRIGKTATNTPWTGEGFFREGYGPLAEWARRTLQVGPAFELNRFRPLDDGEPAIHTNPINEYLERFRRHYQLTPEQSARAEELYQRQKEAFNDWLQSKKPTLVKANVAWGIIERPMTVTERLHNIDALLAEANEILANMRPAMGSEVEKAEYRSLKAEAAKMTAELNAEYDQRFASMKLSLDSVLTDEQKKLGPVPTNEATRRIVILDRITMWSHLVLGACLLLGVFTRVSSFLLAMFLLSVTLIAPALPWAPTPPGAIGHYVFINLYTIEMIALLVLTFVPTGRWFGIDALFSSFRNRREPALVIPSRPIPIRLQR